MVFFCSTWTKCEQGAEMVRSGSLGPRLLAGMRLEFSVPGEKEHIRRVGIKGSSFLDSM